jgi:RpiB/LacA/LacB family sugar-phosphate isomerase
MEIVIGSDHFGYPLKEQLISELANLGHVPVDLGCDGVTDEVDYPDIAEKLAERIASEFRGILVCGTGIGWRSPPTDRRRRAACCHDTYSAGRRGSRTTQVLALVRCRSALARTCSSAGSSPSSAAAARPARSRRSTASTSHTELLVSRRLPRRAGRRLRVSVGHVEWVELLRIDQFPARGEVVEATSVTELAAGSGAIAALQLSKLAGEVTFFTRLTDDERGHEARLELERQCVRVEAVHEGSELRRAFVFVDDTSERTITVYGEKRIPLGTDPLPWSEFAHFDGVCFFCGDSLALGAARRAPILVATARWLRSQARGVLIDGCPQRPRSRQRYCLAT